MDNVDLPNYVLFLKKNSVETLKQQTTNTTKANCKRKITKQKTYT